MGKIMSVLEKYNLIEKDPNVAETQVEPASDEADLTTLENTTIPSSEDTEEETASTKSVIEEETTTMNEIKSTSEPKTVDYARNFSLDEIYELNHLNNIPNTQTIFVLESLLNALPAELTEYVKKTTLNNILTASAMDTASLLQDGEARINHLDEFMNNYMSQTTTDISELKSEIEKLSQMIEKYQKQIKQKEIMLQDQTILIKTEEERIQNILNFFKE